MGRGSYTSFKALLPKLRGWAAPIIATPLRSRLGSAECSVIHCPDKYREFIKIMGIESFVTIIAIFAHIFIFYRSQHSMRRKRLVVSISVLILGYPLMVIGILIGLSGQKDLIPLAKIFLQAPLILSFGSFLVYLAIGKKNV